MRILHVDTGREMAGGQYQVLFLLRGLLARGHQVRLLAPAHSPLRQQRDVPWEPLTLTRLRQHADLVHAHDARGHTFGLASGRPVIVSRRVGFPRSPSLLARWKYSSAARFVAVSQYVRSLLIQEGVPADRIAVVPDGVPVLDPSTLTGGLVAPEKCRPLAQDFSLPITYAKELHTALGSARLMLYFSRMEGLGSGSLLSQAAGVPVIVNRAGGLEETVEDGVTGHVVDLQDRPRIVELVHRFLSDPEETKQFGRRARLRIQEQFSVDQMVARTLEQYQVVLSGSTT